jgi:hypothetical protein
MATAIVARWRGYLNDAVVKAAVEKVGTALGDLFTDYERLDAVTDDTAALLRYQEYVEQRISEEVADFISDGIEVMTFEDWSENQEINEPDLRVVV